jgi:hypothetical protein
VNAPSWLSTLLSVLMLALACYSLWRLLVARAWNRAVDQEVDVLHLAAGIAAAGIVSSWARTLPRPVWTVLFAAAGVYFLVRVARVWADGGERRRLLGALACCAVLVYMFTASVAPSTLHGSTAGQVTMAGMPGMILDQTERFPALGLVFVVGLAFAAVLVVNRTGSMPSPKPAPAVGGPDDGAPLALAPRSVQLCRVLLLLVFAYAILSKLV